MRNFEFCNPTKIFFGKGALRNLAGAAAAYGKNVLLVYGGGSLKRSGLYDDIVSALNAAGKTVFELPGVTPNPRTDKVYEGIALCKSKSVDLILAAGGGSVIDCAKAIAAGSKTERDVWEAFYLNGEELFGATPLATVLTLAGTGSEMNCGSVVTNPATVRKESYGHPLLYPKFSILDPDYTLTLPKHQLINGAVDTMSHIFEQYFSPPDDDNPSDAMSEALLKCLVRNLRAAIKNPDDYEARSNLMWLATLGLNGLIALGKTEDWETHQIEHALSAFYDVPHGAGLAVVTPRYMEYTCRSGLKKYARYAKNVWGLSDGPDEELAKAGIAATAAFFREIGAPTTLRELGIPKERIPEIAATVNLLDAGYKKLTVKDVEAIFFASV